MAAEDHYDEEYAMLWRRFPMPQLSWTDVPAARSGYREYFRQVAERSRVPRDEVAIEDISVPSAVDTASIPVRVYRPESHERGRGLVYLHGGGFSLGDLDVEDQRCRLIARDAGCVVVSVDYRLAPEHTHPVPIEDCYSALRWVSDHAAELAIDRERLGVGGCSAGAALAAGLTQLAQDRDGPRLAMQMLLYAVLDASMSNNAMRDLDEEIRNRTKRMWNRYLGNSRAPYASPADRDSLVGLPPAYVAAAEFDIYRDEAIAYTRALWGAGVHADLHVWPRVPHAFDQLVPEATISRRALQEQAAAVARLLS